MRHIYKFGVAAVTAAGVPISNGHAIAGLDQFPISPGLLEVISDSTDDDVGGVGCESIKVSGLRGSPGSTVEAETTLAMNGTTDVPGEADWYRGFRGRVETGETNVGNIDIKIGGNVVCRIPAGIGTTETAIYSIADNAFGRIKATHSAMLKGSGASPSGIVKIWVKPFVGPWRVFLPPMVSIPENGISHIELHGDGKYMAPACDIKMTCFEFAGTSATILAGFDLNLYELGLDS